MKIHLPNSAFLGNIDPFLKSFEPGQPQKLAVSSNKQWISVHPVVLAMVAALGLETTNVEFETLEAKSKHYLERMGLFDILGIESGIKINKKESAGRFIPLTQIQDANALTDFITEITPLLHLSPEHAEPIKYIVSELVRNVLEHSESKLGGIVSAQYHTKSNTIRIGIVDRGVGILEAIRFAHTVEDEKQAIQLALTPGISGTTFKAGGTELNAGAGLFFIKSIASVNKNFFAMYTGNSLYKLLKQNDKRIKLRANPFDDRHSFKSDLPFWQGTVVGVDISLDQHQDFASLLDLIHDTYIKTLRERRQKRDKKPRFI